MKRHTIKTNPNFAEDIAKLIEESRHKLAASVNANITYLYWKIGQRINDEILNNKRAEYGKQVVVALAQHLVEQYGKGFEVRNLRRMVQFYQIFNDNHIVSTLSTQLSWSHFVSLISIKDELERNFYTQMCRVENWSVRVLKSKINGMLFERTAISKKPTELIKEDLKHLSENDTLSPDLVFKDPYFLDFTGLKNTYSEKSLEDSILKDLESFMLELGGGFTFIERQKRMIIDGEDFYLDLLFYHRKLKRLIAIDLKIGKFKAAYKGQMELYLRWLEKYDKHPDEETPIGLILCAEGNNEQIELLQIEKSGINVAEYLTQLPDQKLLERKLRQVIKDNQNRLDNATK